MQKIHSLLVKGRVVFEFPFMEIKAKLALIFDFGGHVDAFEGNAAEQHGVDEDAEGPHVNFPVVLFFLEDFGCHVVGGAAKGVDLLLLGLAGEAEVADFGEDSFFGFDLEDVFGFDVPVEDIMFVHVGEAMDDFLGDVGALLEGEDALFFVGLDVGDVAEVAVLHEHENPTIIWG